MKKMSRWGKFIAFLALVLTLVLNPVGSLEAIATTVADTTPAITTQESQPISFQSPGNVLLAQIVGQCRAAARTMDIFTEPSVGPTSEIIRTLETNQRVTLANEGSAGWIEVSAPTRGYVIARYLKGCGSNPPPQGNCRRVLSPTEGLVIRAQATSNSSQLGAIYVGNVVRVSGASTTDSAGRNWVEITTPTRGWVSNGFGGAANLSAPFSCP
jgi:hypothetical protein